MLPTKQPILLRSEKRKGFYKRLTQLLVLMWSGYFIPAYAQFTSNFPSPQDMIANIVKQIPALTQMLTALAYVMGMYLIFSGLLKLKQYGEQRTMMSSEHSLSGPLMLLVVGVLLLYIPTSVEVGMSTFWTDPNPYGYKDSEDQWAGVMKNVYAIVQLIGVIAFIRGLVIMSHLGKQASPGTFSKGLTHIIGGILCINIYQTVQVILATLGVTQS